MPWFKRNGSARRSVDDFTRQMADLARDLVTLEINTIVKSNMTAERMPTVPNALLDVAREYLKAFAVMRANVRPVFEADASTPEEWREVRVDLVPPDAGIRMFDLPPVFTFGWLFERIRYAAKNTRYSPTEGRGLTEEHVRLLERIENNADTIRILLDRYKVLRDTEVAVSKLRAEEDIFVPPLELSARDILIVRKMWEIGVEQVVLQTSVQLDGDVVTRIARHLTGDQERTSQILTVHQQAVQSGLGCWRAIIDAAVGVVGGLTGNILVKK